MIAPIERQHSIFLVLAAEVYEYGVESGMIKKGDPSILVTDGNGVSIPADEWEKKLEDW